MRATDTDEGRTPYPKGSRLCLVGLDVGTTSIKAVAFEGSGRPLAHARLPTPTTRPQAGRAEHDPTTLWDAVSSTLRTVTRQLAEGWRVGGVAPATVGEAGVPVDAAGKELRPLISWFDGRAAAEARWWRRTLGSERIYALTGQTVDAHYGACKLVWIRAHEPDVYAAMRTWLSMHDWIIHRLTGELVTDVTIASRTMLLDRRSRGWSSEMLETAGLQHGQLPRVVPSGTQVGTVHSEAAAATGLPEGTPVMTGGHDHLCAAFAARSGDRTPVDSTGTVEGVVLPVSDIPAGDPGHAAHVSCYPDVVPGGYVLSAQVGLAGALVEWLRREMFDVDGADDDAYRHMTSQIPTPLRFSGVVCYPLFGRGVSPTWDPDSARGAFLGLTTTHHRGHLLQAALEGTCFSLRANIVWLEDLTGRRIEPLRVEGGVVRNRTWLQLKADITGRAVDALHFDHTAALGAAVLAGVGVGVYPDHRKGGAAVSPTVERFEPDSARTAEYSRVFHEVFEALPSALGPTNRLLTILGERDLHEGTET
jgi:xylulokinase